MISVARAKERNTLNQNTTKHKRRTNAARDRENDPHIAPIAIADRRHDRTCDLADRDRRSRSRSRRSRSRSRSRRYHDHVDWDRDRTDRDRDLIDCDLAFVCPDLMNFFWVLFVLWGMNDIMYSFGNRENVSNMYKMCFLRYFQEHNQTSENIFRNIFWNATKHIKIFSFPEILLHEPNAAKITMSHKFYFPCKIITLI